MSNHPFISLNILFFLKLRSRIRNRHYLTKVNLPLKSYSAWHILCNQKEDKAFVDCTGLDVATFTYLLRQFQRYQDPHNLERHRIGRPYALDAAGRLGLALYYLNSTMKQKTLCQLFSISPGSVSNLLEDSLITLRAVLEQDYYARIEYPDEKEMQQFSAQIQQRHPNLPEGVFGFMDGVFFPCTNHPDPQVQNRYYNGWKSAPSVTNILVFTPDGCICYAVLNVPGSIHDSRAAGKVYDMLEDRTPDPYKLIADSAFQYKHERLLTPFKRGQLDRRDPVVAAAQLEFHTHIVQARQAAEWGMRTLQGTFGRLRQPMSGTDFEGNQRLLVVICYLFNLRTRRMVEGNQIKTVFDSEYFRDMFTDSSARLRRYYNVVI